MSLKEKVNQEEAKLNKKYSQITRIVFGSNDVDRMDSYVEDLAAVFVVYQVKNVTGKELNREEIEKEALEIMEKTRQVSAFDLMEISGYSRDDVRRLGKYLSRIGTKHGWKKGEVVESVEGDNRHYQLYSKE